MILVLLATFLIIALLEAPGLIRQHYWRELIVFGFLLFLGLIMSILLIFGVNIPLLTTAITDFIKHLFKL